MKNILARMLLLILLTFLWVDNSFAQEAECGTVAHSEVVREILEKRSKENLNIYKSQVPSVKVQPHIIRNDNGTGGLDPNKLPNIIDVLNERFAQTGIQFNSCSPNYIDETDYQNIESGSTEEANMASANVSDAVNIYFVQNSSTSWAYYPWATKDWIVVKNSHADNSSTVGHEMGHYFGLFHTHNGYDDGDPVSSRENVERDPHIPFSCYDCNVNGDGFCDTPADPKLSSSMVGTITGPGNQGTDCGILVSLGKDECGEYFVPSAINIMSYSLKSCRTQFSNQQIARMVATRQGDRSYIASSCGSNNICPAIRIMTDPIDAGTYWASRGITCNGSINSGTVTFNSPSITLNDGFTVSGSTFNAQNTDCNSGNREGEQAFYDFSIQPNPFGSYTQIKFALSEELPVTIWIADMMGRRITTLTNNEIIPAGEHEVIFEAADHTAGMYFAIIQAGRYFGTQKMILTK